jgi:hypothetical protein
MALKYNSVRARPATFDADDQRPLATPRWDESDRIPNPWINSSSQHAFEATNREVDISGLKPADLSWKALILIESENQVAPYGIRKR